MKPFSTPVKPPGQMGTSSNIELDYLRKKLTKREEDHQKTVITIERTWRLREKAQKSLTRLTNKLADMEKDRSRQAKRLDQLKRIIEAEEAKRKAEPIAEPEPSKERLDEATSGELARGTDSPLRSEKPEKTFDTTPPGPNPPTFKEIHDAVVNRPQVDTDHLPEATFENMARKMAAKVKANAKKRAAEAKAMEKDEQAQQAKFAERMKSLGFRKTSR